MEEGEREQSRQIKWWEGGKIHRNADLDMKAQWGVMNKFQVSELGSAWIVMLFTEVSNKRELCVGGKMVTSDWDMCWICVWLGYPCGNDKYNLELRCKAWPRDTDSAGNKVRRVGEIIQAWCLCSEKQKHWGQNLWNTYF